MLTQNIGYVVAPDYSYLPDGSVATGGGGSTVPLGSGGAAPPTVQMEPPVYTPIDQVTQTVTDIPAPVPNTAVVTVAGKEVALYWLPIAAGALMAVMSNKKNKLLVPGLIVGGLGLLWMMQQKTAASAIPSGDVVVAGTDDEKILY